MKFLFIIPSKSENKEIMIFSSWCALLLLVGLDVFFHIPNTDTKVQLWKLADHKKRGSRWMTPTQTSCTTVDGSEIRPTSWYGKYPIIHRVEKKHPRWLGIGFLSHPTVRKPYNFNGQIPQHFPHDGSLWPGINLPRYTIKKTPEFIH